VKLRGPVLALALLLAGTSAHAATSEAQVVAACGTIPGGAYQASDASHLRLGAVTVDVNGNTCVPPISPAPGSTWTVQGNAADNSANSANKLPVLPGRANAAAPSWTEGNQVPFSVDLSGNARVIYGALGQATMAGSIPVVIANNQSAIPVSQSGGWTVTANAGTNLNTSALALESGGNLATVAGIVTASRAAVNPIPGQAGVQGGAGTTTALTQRIAIATDANAVTQASGPWTINVTQWAGGALGAMANYGTSPGAVLVPGVNAFITNTPTVAQATAANLNATVVGTGTFAVQAALNAETTKVIGTVRNLGNAGAITDFAGQNATAPANAWLFGCQFNTTPTTLSSGNASPCQLDSAGNLLVNLKTALPTGANTIGAVTQGTSPWVTRFNTTPSVANGSGVVKAPSSESGAATAITATQTAASNAVLKGSAGNVYYVNVTVGATAGWAMLFDAASLPGNGATGSSLKWCWPVNSDGTKGGITERFDPPIPMGTGAVIGFSSTGCNTLTASATAFFYGQVQ
jgi:hypothetical protein